MAKITFQDHDGKEQTIEISNGLSIMEGAVRNMVSGIDADCGGACSCATCMVYVPEEWRDRLPAKDSNEEAMLQFCPHADERSRLSCQINVTDDLDGLRLSLPESQH
jgi:2Fe-2S ferredoxin